MAGRRRNTQTEQSNTDAQEGTVSTETTEPATEGATTQPAEGTETNTDAAAKPEPKPVDLTAFQAKVAEVLEDKDETTGELAAVHLDAVNQEYRKIDGVKGKNAARAWIDDQMKSEMDNMQIATARAYLSISKGLSAGSSGGSGGSTRTPVDPTEAFVQLTAGLRLSMVLVSANVPEGVSDDWSDKAKTAAAEQQAAAEAYRAWLTSDADDKGDAPETEPWVQAAVKLSVGKSARVGGTRSNGGGASYNGPRRSVEAHILNAFADKESGTFLTIAEIRAVKSEEYGDDAPSSGAISARLFPDSGKCTVEGVVPTTQNDKKGAAKA